MADRRARGAGRPPGRRPRAARPGDWQLSLLLLTAIGVATAGLTNLLQGAAWWFVVMALAAALLAVGAAVRSFTRRRAWGTIAATLALPALLSLFFAPATAVLGLVPTPSTWGAFTVLEEAGVASIAAQAVPAEANTAIVFLLCVGVGAITVLLDLLALGIRAPALTGVPLLALLLVPSFVDPRFGDPLYLVLTVGAWVAILVVRSRRGRAAAFGIAAIAVVAGLVAPAVLPAVGTGGAAGGGSGVASGINPIITLGEDLRRPDSRTALTYTTDQERGVYLRLSSLDEFTGSEWRPTNVQVDLGNTLEAFGEVPGLGGRVSTEPLTTSVAVGDILSRWLPAPYPATSITGVRGDWAWEPEALTVRTDESNARNQEYDVESLAVQPTVQQLTASGTRVPAGLDAYLGLPDDLPAIVAETAVEVVGDAETNYDKALALQGFFRGGEFVYSEQTPVQDGFDGSGATALADFLTVRAGYCVHFSSAMAAMARSLDIPARVAVGFTPGQGVAIPDTARYEFTVTTHNLHAWPELYFDEVGWVRFEPTPGRGNPPLFAPLDQDDPETPDVDESVPVDPNDPDPQPTSSASAPPTSTPAPTSTAAPQLGGSDSATPAPAPWWLVLVAVAAVLLIPAVVRTVRRERRLRRVAAGSAATAWLELSDTTDDLGLGLSATRTPRQTVRDLREHLDDRGDAALVRLLAALESEAFAERPSIPAVADVRAVVASLRRRAGVGRAIAATLLPRSLFARWLPAPAVVE